MSDAAAAETSPFDEYVTMREDALELRPDTPIEAWEDIGRRLGRLGRGVKWYIGDWLRIGEHLYGEKYAQAMEATGYEYQTLVNMHHVCSRVAPETRRGPELSYAHHAEVARFETAAEQAAWLRRAIDNKWTVRELREQIKAALREDRDDEEGEADPEESTLTAITRIAKAALNNWWEETYANGNFAALLGGQETAGQRDRLFGEIAHSIALSCVNEGIGE